MGDSVKSMSDTYMKGGSVEDIRKAGKDAAIQGSINATVDIAFDLDDTTPTGADKVIANTAVKDLLTLNDADEVKLEKFQEAQEKAENDANAEAVRRFREAQKEWSERKKDSL